MQKTLIAAQRRPHQLVQLCAACTRVASGASTMTTARCYATQSSRRHQTSSPAASASPRRTTIRACRSSSGTIPRCFSNTAAAASAAAPERTETSGPATDKDTNQKQAPRPGEPDYYALFPQTLPSGPPPAGPFAIDTRALRREYLQLQAAVHPDFHHAAGGSSSNTTETDASAADDNGSSSSSNSAHSPARRRAEAASSYINAAYKTLSSPLLRAQYLLDRQHGLDLAGDEAASLAAPDPELLGEVMMAREEVEEAEVEADLEGPRRENEERISECEEGLGRAFAEGRVDEAVALTVRLKYWLNVRETIDNWEPGRPAVLQH
ncbi:hypothetical protein MCOR25_001459 [Pyricularia grisea]|uniref:Co-chaperone HscB C-terminal oligomerisation domain-containing protein n=1 Tax=Pyricularia grisea TaxID=148305 RepID=A0A6P8AWD0_PYRGI|nr:uncharacterized protein PgNI_09007 [Pyricularia grisea]KAI6380787.1 hypothetical protein MCOR25_001459 [Pyricularia grisea]TLD06505.1 hypothetical protein PgNI_09007 [Pyricularia grisea]